MKHSPEVVQRATDLFFKIEKHILLGGNPLSFKNICVMLNTDSSAVVHSYVNILIEWKLINKVPGKSRSITLVKTNYPPVEYRDLKGINKHA